MTFVQMGQLCMATYAKQCMKYLILAIRPKEKIGVFPVTSPKKLG